MLFRFSLYGFLKNQLYFEPFLVLVFLQKGLSFFQIGLLIAFRELTINLFEILSGAWADLYGRRRAMIISFAAYIISFALFGMAQNQAMLYLAMFMFGIGSAFRTGTHKAMIFSWLRSQGRICDKTEVYGRTRSWSKMGSAVAVVLAALFVLTSNRYEAIFYLSIVPYLIGIINFLGYPKDLDRGEGKKLPLLAVFSHLKDAFLGATRQRELRRLLFESMGYEGVFRAAKDYLQPVLQASALGLGAALTLSSSMGQQQQVALLVGPVYFVLFLLSAWASRQAHGLTQRAGGEEEAARWIWRLCLLGYGFLLLFAILNLKAAMIAAFVFLFILQNAWRPILISRFDNHCQEEQGATVLSIESQGKTFSTMLLAPLMGLLVDLTQNFWPVAAMGALAALIFVLKAPSPSQKKCITESGE